MGFKFQRFAVLIMLSVILIGMGCQSGYTSTMEDASFYGLDIGEQRDSTELASQGEDPWRNQEDSIADSPENGAVFSLRVHQLVTESEFSCAVTDNGEVYCWGQDHGPSFLSASVYGNHLRAQHISELHNIIQVSVSYYGHACALERTGRVWCWGFNYDGSLGVDSQEVRVERPRLVSGIAGVTHVATASDQRTFARLSDGSMYYWGPNVRQPQRVTTLGRTEEVHSSYDLTCARLALGGHACQADAQFYNFERSRGSENMSFLRAGGSGVWCGLKPDHSLWCGGSNTVAEAAFPPEMSQLCSGSPDRYGFVPQWRCLLEPHPVSSLQGVEEVAAGALTTCARLQDGTAWCWGGGFVGSGDVASRFVTFGDGRLDGETCEDFPSFQGAMPPPFPCRRRPVQIVGLSGVTTIAVGYRHACAALAAGGVRCWGTNDRGQLGDGTTTHRATPVPLRM